MEEEDRGTSGGPLDGNGLGFRGGGTVNEMVDISWIFVLIWKH